jgi:hypothetical protein
MPGIIHHLVSFATETATRNIVFPQRLGRRRARKAAKTQRRGRGRKEEVATFSSP